MKLFLLLFISLILTSRIEIPLPVGPISNHPIYGPLNYTISNMRLNMVDPGIGLTNVTWYRVLNKLPEDFPSDLIPLLAFHLKSASSSFRQAELTSGEILIVTGESKCGPEVRLVSLTSGNLDHLIPSSTLIEQKMKCCSKVLDSHYGTKSCKGSKERTIYLVTPGSTYYNWLSGAEGPLDPPLDFRGLKQAEDISDIIRTNADNIDLVISGSQDANVFTGEILSRKLKTQLWIDDTLSQRCGLQYESWRLLQSTPFRQNSKSIMSLLNDLSTEYLQIVLVMNSCMANDFVKSIGYSKQINPGSILEINFQNLTGISYWYFHPISNGYGSSLCPTTCDPSMTLDIKLLEGSEVDYKISQLDLLKFTPTEQNDYFRFQYEREVWTKIYWDNRRIFREDLFQEKYDVRYWGKFPVKNQDSDELIGIYWFEVIKSIWFKNK